MTESKIQILRDLEELKKLILNENVEKWDLKYKEIQVKIHLYRYNRNIEKERIEEARAKLKDLFK